MNPKETEVSRGTNGTLVAVAGTVLVPWRCRPGRRNARLRLQQISGITFGLAGMVVGLLVNRTIPLEQVGAVGRLPTNS